MDVLTYDPALPELPLLRGLRLVTGDTPAPPRFDWGAYVIRLAQVVAERQDRPTDR
jgi:hypothetical protein